MKKRIIVRISVLAVIFIAILVLLLYIFIPKIAQGNLPGVIHAFTVIIFIIPLFIAFLISLGGVHAGWESLKKIIKWFWKKLHDIQGNEAKPIETEQTVDSSNQPQEDFRSVRGRYLEQIRVKLESIAAAGHCAANERISTEHSYVPIALGKVENSYGARSFGKEGNLFADDNYHLPSDPERLIRKDQAYLQYRLMADTHKIAFKDHHYYVLVAPPGSGKTYYLKLLALRAANKNLAQCEEIVLPEKLTALMPVYIDLVTFSQSERIQEIMSSAQEPKATDTIDALHAFITDEWTDNHQFSIPDLEESLAEENRRLLFLLDGLDEISDKQQNKMIKIIQSLVVNCKPAYFIIAKRDHQEQDALLLPDFIFLPLEDFSPVHIYRFITKWNKIHHIPPHNSRSLDSVIVRHPRLQALAAIPLALSHMDCMHRVGKSLHLNRAELYKKVTEDLFDRWNKGFADTASPDSLDSTERKQMINYLAWHMHNSKNYRYNEKELKEAISHGLNELKINDKNVDIIYDELILSNGLIRAEVGDREHFRFLCFPLQEYLTSEFLKTHRRKMNKKFIYEHYDDPWWEEVLMLFISGITRKKQVDTLIEWLDTPMQTSPDKFLIKPLFAGQVLAMCKHSHPTLISEAMLDKITARLCRLLTESTPLYVREKIGYILIDLGKTAITRHELANLSQIDVKENDILATWSEKIPSARSIFPFLLSYLNIPGADEKLFQLPYATKITLVTTLTDTNLDDGMLVGIVSALGILDKREFAATLCELLKNKNVAPSVKANIARVLGILGDWEQVTEMLKYLPDNQVEIHNQAKWAIVNALGVLGHRRGYWQYNEDSGKRENCLFNDLKSCIEEHEEDKYDSYVRWNIVIMLYTAFFARPVQASGADGKLNRFKLDPGMFPASIKANLAAIVHTEAWLLIENNNAELTDLLDNIQQFNNNQTITADIREEEWYYVWETIGQLADFFTMQNITDLENITDGRCKNNGTGEKCKLGEKCRNGGQCKHASSIKLANVQESIAYAEYLVMRRVKASAS